MNKIAEGKACGKLYIAGEYAVVCNKSAIIVPIKKYIKVKLTESDNYYLKSNKYHDQFIKLDLNSYSEDSLYIVKTIRWFNKYLEENAIKSTNLKIEVTSELDLSSLIKFGFGSSGAITIALLRALCNFYEITYDSIFLYKAGVMIQSQISKHSSFGDLACIAFEDAIYYKKFNEKIFDSFINQSITNVLLDEWFDLIIEPLNFNYKFLIVHTNKNASSNNLVEKVTEFKNHIKYFKFLERSEELVLQIKNSKRNIIDIIIDIDENLLRLEQITKVKLITSEMINIKNIIKKYRAGIKFSGAGGGDCVICFFEKSLDLELANIELTTNGYHTLIYPLKRGIIMNRKDEHIKLALNQDKRVNDFDKIRFIHNGILKTSINEIDLSTKICGKQVDYPFYINAMTGGSNLGKEINNKLSSLANYFNIPIATGSFSAALKDDTLIDSFTIVRDKYPSGLVMANIGADKTVEDAKKAVELLNANILQIHINQLQELIMPEGERDFRKWQTNIKNIIDEINVPVIVKEVGFGMSKNTIEILKELGAKTVDISGKGGTNFAVIENSRRDNPFPDLNSWGLSTVESLLEATNVDGIDILASGGIRSALDIIKALALGANAVGLSSYFLKLVTKYTLYEAIKEVEQLIYELKVIMTLLGAHTISDLKKAELIFDETLINFMKQRKINFIER